jgi:peptidoglycan glycosyltransferase
VHTDFVFAAASEEFGLAGALVIIALYGVLLLRGLRTAARTRQPFERFLAAGLTVGLVIQAWVIMAGNIRLAPIAGVTLPFVSYGGSSLLISFIALSLLLRISESATNQPTNQLTNHSLLRLACVLSLALTLLAAMCGYWTIARADDLRARDDNPRRVLYEQRIVRGRILDRHGTVLADTESAQDGVITRRYPIPEAAPVIGYASLRYGTGGIEATFDAELRGEGGQTVWQAAWDELLHHPPQGHDVQLTLDTALQIKAQNALAGHSGAIVLLDVAGGDVLVLASSPTFDPEHLDETWEALREDPAAPLLNRATQGLYQPGAALQTIVLAEALDKGLAVLTATVPNASDEIAVNGAWRGCNTSLTPPYTLAGAYAAACPAPFADLSEQLGANGLTEAVERWKLAITPPALEIPTEAVDWTGDTLNQTATLRAEGVGQGDLTVSPLQMALVAGTLANDGSMPAARLVLRIQDKDQQWYEQAGVGEIHTILTPVRAQKILAAWQRYDGDIAAHWGTAVAGESQPPHTWFLGIAPASAPRYTVAILIERTDEPETTIAIGTALLQAALRQ